MGNDRAGRPPPGWSDRLYFSAATVISLLLVLYAFTPSFYLHSQFHRPAPTPFIAVHGVLMTAWMVILAVQAMLIWLGKVKWHRRLGYAGLVLAAVIVPMGCMATLASAAREIHAHSRIVPFQMNVLGLELMQMALFGGFVAAAMVKLRTDHHKRLMLMATMCILPNAVVRLSFMPGFEFLRSNFDILNLWTAVLLGIVALDALRIRKLHPAFVRSVPLAVAGFYFAWWASMSAPWSQFWQHSLG